MEASEPLNQPPFFGGRAGLESLVEEALAEIHAAQHVLVGDGDLVELHVGTGVLDVCFHQRRALLDRLDQHLFAPDGLDHQGLLLGGERVNRLVLGLFLGVRARRSQGDEQQSGRILPKIHVNSCLIHMFQRYSESSRGPARLLFERSGLAMAGFVEFSGCTQPHVYACLFF